MRVLFWFICYDVVKLVKFCVLFWSWVLWKGEVGWLKFYFFLLVMECKICYIYVVFLGLDLFGRVKGGYVDLIGLLCLVLLCLIDVSVLVDNDFYRVDLF